MYIGSEMNKEEAERLIQVDDSPSK
jgi:hypothetical protein